MKRSFSILDGGITLVEVIVLLFLLGLALFGLLKWIGVGVGLFK